MKYKYLKELGIKKPKELCSLDLSTNDKKQIKKYGACWTEIMNFDTTMEIWLYNHLKFYLEEADKLIDLDYRKYTYNGETKTVRQAIEFILTVLANTIKSSHADLLDEKIKDNENEIQLALHWLAEIFFNLWI